MTDLQIMQGIKSYVAQCGIVCAEGLLENFYLSLKARPFVLLTGHHGTDMTRLPVLFAQAIGATQENGRFKLLTVRPDWMDSSDLFGCLNLEGKFIPGAIIDFLKAAQADPDKPYFLCLDRINLSRAEYYLRELLGAVESRAKPGGEKPFVTMAYYGRDTSAAEQYGIIPALENLYIIGTVDLDEASRPLNQRLLDRVHTVSVEAEDITGTPACMPAPVDADNAFLLTRYYQIGQEVPEGWFGVFEALNKILVEASAYVGYQLRNDGILYLMHNQQTGVLPQQAALDQVICRKVLTRVQGSAKAIGGVLSKLQAYCEETYPQAAKKIDHMLHLCQTEGFASCWD